jgi:outer membrane protein OmpA-like peptidoglycan-associated protein
MKIKFITLFCLLLNVFAFAQNKSKADNYFFEYAYNDAIKQYNAEKLKKPLTNQQYLNLADSYLKIREYEKASEIYATIYEKDSTLSSAYISKLLVAFSKSENQKDKVQYYLTQAKDRLPKELTENSDLNSEILANNKNIELGAYIFNCTINSAQADFSPAFYEDQIMFTSGRPKGEKEIYKPSGEAYLDIYSGKIQLDGDVTVPRLFSKIPTSNYHKATPFYVSQLDDIIYMLSNADGEDLLFDKNGKNTLAIGAVNDKGDFRYLLRDLSTSFYYPFYHGETNKLYFAADFEYGYGGTDIYYVYTNNGQIMSAPVNLGPRINTPANEIAPYIFEDDLYFSSDIFYGFGGMDVYVSSIQLDDTLSIPVNLGDSINSDKDDFGFIIKNNSRDGGLLGYFSSNRSGGKGNDDIYGFKLKQKPGLKTIIIKGEVTNTGSGKALSNFNLVLLDENGSELRVTNTDQEGKYQFEIPFTNNYTIKASREGYGIFNKSFSISKDGAERAQFVDIQLASINDVVEEKYNKDVLKINKLYFDKSSSVITTNIAKELDKVVATVSSFPSMKLKIESHTTSKGSNTYNLALSQNRAEAIKSYLLSKGVSINSIVETVGYGEAQLLNQCKNGVYCLEFLHNQNERSIISVLNYDELVN